MAEKDYAHYAGQGANAIIMERMHQLDIGYTVDHDNRNHSPEELMRIAACYLDFAANDMEGQEQDSPHPFWPSDTSIPWKPEETAVQNAVKAGAFTMAALDLFNMKAMEGLA